MKYLTFVILVSLNLNSFSQSIESSFFAIIVSDMDSSLDWYQNKLGFEVASDVTVESRGIRQINLSKNKVRLELIQTQSSVSSNTITDQNSRKATVQGFFKIGFDVDDFDFWIAVLKKMEVNFRGDVVTDDNGKRMVIALDPDGNRIQFFEQ